eukprot:CAMPEP_0178929494 /NCGR_PEP_ID=MMETSP0786-20121207/20631_1 /TAXON_ID=186022 /ORGANISM="Thalassionema frauenfeldii, Strain CCMP 1798" /LENGTH=403 /DNA_ID=CAMNT_0020605757 /DNA_START=21 /DNA_END=1232 /DNA_ORIENTATION=+
MRRSIYLTLLLQLLNQTSFSIIFGPVTFQRRPVLRQLGSMVASTTSLISSSPHSVDAFSSISQNVPTSKNVPKMSTEQSDAKNVAYRAFAMDVMGEKIPVAMLYQINNNQEVERVLPSAKYLHRISVRRIGELLARWDFVPQFVAKNYQLKPTLNNVFDGTSVPVPSSGPVVLFAHGYLGSRFDLSHIAEALAQDGFICLSAEYPESLAASYAVKEDLDRATITNQLLTELTSSWGVSKPTSFGIVGHSLGTGTVITTGDNSWARVCLAGFPRRPNTGRAVTQNALYISSMNDGAVSPGRFGGASAVPSEFSLLEELNIPQPIPKQSMLLVDRPDAPNHISFLTNGVNDSMINLLSPLLPVAEALKIPVLDFDKYQVSKDSDATARLVIPLVKQYLKEQMKAK